MATEYLCVVCGVVCKYKYGKLSKNLFCSSECQWALEWKSRKEYIKDTGFVAGSKEARRYLIDVDGYGCKICNTKVWNDKPVPLVCDHIDGNSDNWHLSNLRMICCNCDAQTDTYKNRNKGKGRHYRRLRYKQGKSY